MVFAAGGHGAGCVQQLLACGGLQLMPTLERAPHQWHVGRILVVGEPDYTVDAVRRALVVGYVELFESQDAESAAGEFVYRGRTHPSDAHYYDVVSLSGRHFILCPVKTLVPLCA